MFNSSQARTSQTQGKRFRKKISFAFKLIKQLNELKFSQFSSGAAIKKISRKLFLLQIQTATGNILKYRHLVIQINFGSF